MGARLLHVGTFALAVCLAFCVVAAEKEPSTGSSERAVPVRAGGCDKPADLDAKIDAMLLDRGRERSVEIRRVPVDEATIDALIRAGKTAGLDLQSGERVYEHITDYLPKGWGAYEGATKPVDSMGNPIVNQVPGLPGWGQRDVDSLRAEIARWRDLLPTLGEKERLESEAILGNYIGQALVRGIAIVDLVDLGDGKVVTDRVAKSAIEQLHFFENLKAARAEDGGHVYEPSRYDDGTVGFIESHGGNLDEVLAIEALEKRATKAAPSGCYYSVPFARGVTLLSGGNTIWEASGDDDASASVYLIFPFYFYPCDSPGMNPNKSVLISTNGYVSFHQQANGAEDGTNWSNDPIPFPEDPDGYAAPSWDDYFIAPDQGSADKVKYKTEGAVGERVFTVEWQSVSRFGGDPDDYHTFQVKLFEATGNVELQTASSLNWQQDYQDSSTIGIESFGGLDGDCGPNCNNDNMDADITYNYRFGRYRPANDLTTSDSCVGVDTPWTSDTFGATGTDVTSCSENDFKDVWVLYHAPMSGDVTFDTCAGTTFDTTLAVFDDGGAVEIGCNDDFCSYQSSVTVALAGGSDYWVRIAGYLGEEGVYTLTATPSHGTPVADTCGDPWVIGGSEFALEGLTGNNSGCRDATSCALRDTVDEWYAWTSPVTGTATATTVHPATDFDTTLAVFDSCDGNELACNDDTSGTLQSIVEWPVVQGNTYFVRVAGVYRQFGAYHLTVTTIPTIIPSIFSDGFESGNTSAWSSTTP